jgi:hypothetical protein
VLRPLIVAALCAAALSCRLSSAVAQPASTELETYIQAVVAHQPGTFDPAQDAVQQLTERETLAVARAVKALTELFERRRWQANIPAHERVFLNRREYTLAELAARCRFAPDRPNDIRPFLKRAALFHLDAMIAYAGGGASGWVQRHENLGHSVAGVLVTVCHETQFAADWWLAVTGALTLPMPQVARVAGENALRSVTGHATLELAAGSVYEVLASSRVQEAAAALESESQRVDGLDPAANLRRAAQLFRSAAERSGRLPEAHLRLGRVLSLSGDSVGARERLERARQEAPNDLFIAYHAAMFLGDLEEAAGRAQGAEIEYQKALALVPSAQAPRLALSHLRHASGRIREALDDIAGFLAAARPIGDREEPWLTYSLGAGRETNSVFGRLVQEIDR